MTYERIGFSQLWKSTRLNCSATEMADRVEQATFTSDTMTAMYAGTLSVADRRQFKELVDWMYSLTVSGPYVCARLGDMIMANVKSMEGSLDEEAETERKALVENISSIGFREGSGEAKRLGDTLSRDMIMKSGSQEDVVGFEPDPDKGRLFMIPGGVLPPEDCEGHSNPPTAPPTEFHRFRYLYGNWWFTTFVGAYHARAYTRALKNAVGSATDLKWFQSSISVAVDGVYGSIGNCRSWTPMVGGSERNEYSHEAKAHTTGLAAFGPFSIMSWHRAYPYIGESLFRHWCDGDWRF